MKHTRLTENEARTAIKVDMVRNGMRAKDLADKLGVSPAYVSMVLKPDGKNISKRICTMFGLERVSEVVYLKAKEQQS